MMRNKPRKKKSKRFKSLIILVAVLGLGCLVVFWSVSFSASMPIDSNRGFDSAPDFTAPLVGVVDAASTNATVENGKGKEKDPSQKEENLNFHKEENDNSLKNEEEYDSAKQRRYGQYLNRYNYRPPWRTFTRPDLGCGTAPEYDDFFALSSKHRSRLQEDQIIYERFFKKVTSGTYVELGAFDGETESNTRFFDVCLGWKGLLIEGNPTTFSKMKQARKQAHRMSFAPSCLAENATVKFFKYPMANSGLEGKALTYTGRPTISVNCGALGPVLQDVFEGEPINFFSLYVEGSESRVLESIDFDKVMIDVLMIEVENYDCPAEKPCEGRNATRAVMAAAGYIRHEKVVIASDVYVRPDSPYQLGDVPLKLTTAPPALALKGIKWIY